MTVVDRPAREAPEPSARSSRPAAHAIFRAVSVTQLAQTWRKLRKDLFDPYRPELHYMRGPGPKWHEKHANARPLRAALTPCFIRAGTLRMECSATVLAGLE
jgi:hypothetical protein